MTETGAQALNPQAAEPFTAWSLRNLRVDDNRLETLRAAYERLALDPTHSALAMSITAARRLSDAQHAVLLKELQHHRERLCRECEGRTYVPNPEARYTEDYCDGRPTGQYSTNDPEEIECPCCDGIGYEKPERPKPALLAQVERDDGEPF
jgi:hypothetical protein